MQTEPPPTATDAGRHRVDVLIPAYNAASTIVSAVASITAQTLRDIVIHIVDDGSTDATPALLAGLAEADPRIRIHHKPNGGIVDALNYGLTFCTAEFIARHDADDLAYPDRLAVQLAWLDGHPDTVAVGASVRHIDSEGRPTGAVVDLPSPDLADAFQVPSREPYIIHPFLMVRRAAVEVAGGYRHVHFSEDTDLYWRLSELSRLHNLPDVLGEYRLHDQSVSSASVTNGRIAAVSSQLAALSSRRRRAGRDDLVFAKGDLVRMREAGDLAAIVEVAGAGLDAGERVWLAEASAAKLLELASYRPFELDAADCRFIGATVVRDMARLPAENRSLLSKSLNGTAARLAAAGRWADAAHLFTAASFPGFAVRYVLRAPMLGGLKRRLRRDRAADAMIK